MRRIGVLVATTAALLGPAAAAQAGLEATPIQPRATSSAFTAPFGQQRAPGQKVPKLVPGNTPVDYYALESIPIPPQTIQDDQLLNYTVQPFYYGGQSYTQIGVSANGYVIVGGGSAPKDAVCCVPKIGSVGRPNGVIAPFWTDLVPGSTGVRVATVANTSQPPGERHYWFVAQWDAPGAVDTTVRRAQVWIRADDPEAPPGNYGPADEEVFVTYDHTTMATPPVGQEYVVGAETVDGSAGHALPGMPQDNYMVNFVDPNSAPTAVADSASTTMGEPLTVGAPGVLGNDTDPEGDALTAHRVTQAAHGTVALNADGGYTYTPDAGYTGPDVFTYTASDGDLASDPVPVAISVGPRPNAAPNADDDSYTTGEGQPLTVAAPGVLAGDTDPDGDPLQAVSPGAPSHGTLMLAADGSFTYTPDAGYRGPDSFSYRASDGTLLSDRATVALTVTARANAAPAAAADGYEVLAGEQLAVVAPGVLANDTDADGDPLTTTGVNLPAHGTLALAADGSFTYTPDAGYAGTDRFGYQATDGRDPSALTWVTMTVKALPVASPEPTPTPTAAPSPPPATEAGDRTPPIVTVFRMPQRVRVARLSRRGITPEVRCDEACAVVARLKVRRPGATQGTTILQTRATAFSDAAHKLRLRVPAKALKRLGRRTAELLISASDRTGNRTIVARRIRLVR